MEKERIDGLGPIYHFYSKEHISCGVQVEAIYLDMEVGISIIETLSIIESTI